MNWKNTSKIVKALLKRYPNVSVNEMPEAELIKKVTSLPFFFGKKQPPDKSYVNSIIFEWGLKSAVKSAKEHPHETFYINDSAYI